MDEERGDWSRGVAIVLGILLVAAGVVLLAVQVYGIELPFDLGRVGWPVFVIAPGLVLLVAGLAVRADPGIGLAIAGGIVTTVGLILAYQSQTGHYSSWAYAWALVAPGSVGASMLLWAILHRRGGLARSGLGALFVGLVLFLIGFAFFEGVLGIGGERGLAPLGRQALPLALIVAGVLVILTRLWPRRRRRRWPEQAVPYGPPPGPPTVPPPEPAPARTGRASAAPTVDTTTETAIGQPESGNPPATVPRPTDFPPPSSSTADSQPGPAGDETPP